jgi:hypothetical protein
MDAQQPIDRKITGAGSNSGASWAILIALVPPFSSCVNNRADASGPAVTELPKTRVV